MTSAISPPQRRNIRAKTPNARPISGTSTQSSVPHGSQSGPLPRVQQYDGRGNHAWPCGRSPPTCPRSMRPASTSSACKVSGALGTSIEASGPNPGGGIAQAVFLTNSNKAYLNTKSTDSDGTTSSGSALLASSSKVSSGKMKKCHSCRKPQNTDERPPWVRCSKCKHRNHTLCCKSEGPEKEIVQ